MNLVLNKVYLFILIFSILFLLGCPDYDKFRPDSKIIFENNSEKRLLYDVNFYGYPDTSLVNSNPFSDKTQKEISMIQPYSKKIVDTDLKKGFISNEISSRIMIFLFDTDTIEQVPWEKIKATYNILRRYDVSKEDFEKANWELEIAYP